MIVTFVPNNCGILHCYAFFHGVITSDISEIYLNPKRIAVKGFRHSLWMGLFFVCCEVEASAFDVTHDLRISDH